MLHQHFFIHDDGSDANINHMGVWEITSAKKLKVIIPLLMLCLLAACGDPKLGDVFRLERTAQGGMDVHSMEKAVDEMKKLEKMGNPDSVEEHLDLREVTSFSVGTVVKVTEVNDTHHMVQIQNMNPTTGGIKMWITKKELRRSM